MAIVNRWVAIIGLRERLKKSKWFWFFFIYIISVLAIAAFALMVRWLLGV